MIAGILVRASRHAPASVSLGIGLGLAASLSSQRQQQGTSHADSTAVAPATRKRAGDTANIAATVSGGSKGQGSSGNDKGKDAGTKEPTLREDMIGSYEDRIRNFSSAERVFEFFASVTNDRGTFMTPEDFARSITPYQHRKGVKVGSDNFKYNFQAKHRGPTKEEVAGYKEVMKIILDDARVTPQEVREMIEARKRFHITVEAHLEVLEDLGVTQVHLDELALAKGGISRERFLAMVDIDGDGLISYEEYMLFRTLLSLPRRKLSIAFRMFDRDDSGAIDGDEFESFMEVLRGETNVGRTEGSRRRKESYADVAQRLFMGQDGSGQMTLDQFAMFVRLLQREALVMQFNQCDARGQGLLTSTDFAKFLVTKVNSDRHLYKEYMKRAESEAVAKLQVDISVEEFLAFQEILQHLPEMEVAMKVSGSVEGKGLDRKEFVRAVEAALEGGRLKQQPGDLFLRNATPERVRKRDLFFRKLLGPAKAIDSYIAGGSSSNNNTWVPRMPPPPSQHSGGGKTLGDESKSGAFKDKEGDRRGDAVGGDGGKEGGRREGEVMSPGIVDTLFALLDVNSNGRLDQNEFMTLMKRQSAVPDPPRNIGVVAFLRRFKDCAEDVIT
eukprot:jgi/Undpi1/3726/HiC_scaffold_16.g07095.m1